MISDETVFVSLPPAQAFLQSVAKPRAAAERDAPALHREFRDRRVLAPTPALTQGFEPGSLWLSALIFTGRDDAFKSLIALSLR